MGLLRWDEDELKGVLRREVIKRLKVSAEVVRSHIVKLISVSVRKEVETEDNTIKGVWGGGKYFITYSDRTGEFRIKGKKKRTKYMIYRSKPGEPPRTDTGALRKSIFWAVNEDELTAIVGTPLDYGLYLELGTSKMAPRPYWRVGFQQAMPRVRAIFSRPLPKAR